MLDDNIIIPVEIMQICAMFYSMGIAMIYHHKYNLKMEIIQNRNISKLSKIQQMNDKPQPYKRESYEIASSCFIPNISSEIDLSNTKLSSNKSYDGVLSIGEFTAMGTPYSYSIKYDTNLTLLNETSRNEHKAFNFKSKTSFTKSRMSPLRRSSLLYCEDKKIVILFDERGISCFDLKGMHLSKSIFNFKPLTMEYLGDYIGNIHDQNRLFCLECGDDFKQGYIQDMDAMINSDVYNNDFTKTMRFTLTCKIFDIDKKESVEGKEIKLDLFMGHACTTFCKPAICRNNIRRARARPRGYDEVEMDDFLGDVVDEVVDEVVDVVVNDQARPDTNTMDNN